MAKILSEHAEIARVEIQGHTDDQGSADHNLDLSNRRAEAVRTWLVRAGIAPHRLAARGYGKNQPIATNATAAGRALNRRVQFVIEGGAAAGSATGSAASTIDSCCGVRGRQRDGEHADRAPLRRHDRQRSRARRPVAGSIGEYRRLDAKGEVRERGRIVTGTYANARMAMVVAALLIADAPYPADVQAEFKKRIAGYPAESEDQMAMLLVSKRTVVVIGAMGGPGLNVPTTLKALNPKATARRAER